MTTPARAQHPLDMFALFRRWPASIWRNLVYTALWSSLIGLALTAWLGAVVDIPKPPTVASGFGFPSIAVTMTTIIFGFFAVLIARELPGRDRAGLELFVRETRRAELGHWWAMACGPLFVLWNPPLPATLLVAYGVGINLPFIAIQRYNRIRTRSVIARLDR